MVDLARHGYDQIPCVSTWACHQNIAQIIQFFEDEGMADEHLLGFLTAPWHPTDREGLYTLLNDAHRNKYARRMFESLHPEE